jgi:hypothetical protein
MSSVSGSQAGFRAAEATLRWGVLFLIAFVAAPALAQTPDLGTGRSAACLPSSSRARESCEPTKSVIGIEKELSISLEIPARKLAHCATAIEVQYEQRNTLVNVEGRIENKDCAASYGEYTLVVTIKDERSELDALEFVESWKREDERPVIFMKNYEIGENVDLVSVRPRRSRCSCGEASTE